jgi:A/G-specific adenine glycosylase
MKSKTSFLDTLFGYYDLHGRDLPWRQTTDPYKIMVSELMLQQTQVQRVIPKYEAFIKQFLDVETLAKAELATVLKLWSGLGYNRRAKFLHESAKQLAQKSQFLRTIDELVALPGIGKNTAGAILVYAFDEPHVFIETNVRSCLFEHFFQKEEAVTDKQLEEILKELLPLVDSPRHFYWAMMDYGTYLKKQKNNIQKSKHYAKQTPFEGSKRQIRGRVLRLLGQKPRIKEELQENIADNRLDAVVTDLIKEGLIREDSGRYSLG